MSLSGLRVVRFRGRYFVYGNWCDSHPSELGKSVACDIPNSPEQYRAWLAQERQRYLILTEDLESKILSIPEERLHSTVAFNAQQGVGRGCGEEFLAWRKVSRRPYKLPTPLCDVGTDLMIDWTYIIDLDEELFSINNCIHLDLWDVSSSQWIEAFSIEGDNIIFDWETAPEAYTGIMLPDYFDPNEGDCEKYHLTYQEYQCLPLSLTNTLNFNSCTYVRQVFALSMFVRLVSLYDSQFRTTIPQRTHTSFTFREITYAMLCFATAQFRLDELDCFIRCSSIEDNGYMIDPRKTGQPRLMPSFGSMCHMSNQEPGCAPLEDIYWFQGVLVALVPDPALSNNTTDAISAKVVELGKSEGRVEFRAILFSIERALMLDVKINDGATSIKRSAVTSIIASKRSINEAYGRGDIPDSEASDPQTPLAQLCQRWEGFLALQNFMIEPATPRFLFDNSGILPLELYAKIIAEADYATQATCRRVCRAFRALTHEPFRYSCEFSIIGFEPTTKPSPRPWESYIGSFVFQDRESGCILRSVLDPLDRSKPKAEAVTRWIPVIGHAPRPCILPVLEVKLRLEKLE